MTYKLHQASILSLTKVDIKYVNEASSGLIDTYWHSDARDNGWTKVILKPGQFT